MKPESKQEIKDAVRQRYTNIVSKGGGANCCETVDAPSGAKQFETWAQGHPTHSPILSGKPRV